MSSTTGVSRQNVLRIATTGKSIRRFVVDREVGTLHAVGDFDCKQGWCGDSINGYPRKCDCGGLVHAEFGDEDWDGDYWLITKCDTCREQE